MPPTSIQDMSNKIMKINPINKATSHICKEHVKSSNELWKKQKQSLILKNPSDKWLIMKKYFK